MRARFATRTGGIYEIDTTAGQIRRLAGPEAPTPNQGADGEWRDYLYASPLTIGRPVLVEWRIDETPGGIIVRRTMTSQVTGLTVVTTA